MGDQETVFVALVYFFYILHMWTCSSATCNHNMNNSTIHSNSTHQLNVILNTYSYWPSYYTVVSGGQITVIAQWAAGESKGAKVQSFLQAFFMHPERMNG